ncbi:MAG: hypothetical protein A3B31_03845 [Candidatus Komeilibacteria bacterium RIFCSPLOWO2_01_FULL_53_11]|uniref:Prepilin-type N-terminal cleavage/methylation domain-containing protein n=1 Tax=Candidatus Komeilibacteria bacterium RIFCSPLOWO2_01_FULL_53_11 TaxID=1798552 RepID=A0A1G2BU25_9BACT|nr:MAG: hypothetical protein A3B31_03845 [Candidatus Komeilibacteria bacterium RIFCSPLOWO2_01_FULL_53_11]
MKKLVLTSSQPETTHAGYTIVELIVTVAVFGLAFIAIGAIFIGFSTAQSHASASQRLLNEGNFVLEAVAREIRMNAIDYGCGLMSYSYICLTAPDGTETHFRFNDPSAPNILQTCSNPVSVDASCPWANLHSSDVVITNVEFHVFPQNDPFAPNASDGDIFQPITTILMTIQAGTGRAQQVFDLQTSVTSRLYTT